MITYDELLDEAEQQGLCVCEAAIPYEGAIIGKYILIDSTMPTVYKKCALAEELGHHYTTVGNIIDQSVIANVKQELTARAVAYMRLIPIEELKRLFKKGILELWEIAEHFEVTDAFLNEAIECYKRKGLLY